MSDVPVDAEIAAARSTTPDKLRHTLRGDLDTIAAKALQKTPQGRYLSVTALADDLRRWLRHDPIQRPAGYARLPRRQVCSPKPVRGRLVGTGSATAPAGVVGTLLQAQMARRQRDFAFRQLARAEQINSLNHFLLTDAAPAGTVLTVNDLLTTAERIVEHENNGGGAARVEALISIGMRVTQTSTKTADRSLCSRKHTSCLAGSTILQFAPVPRAPWRSP